MSSVFSDAEGRIQLIWTAVGMDGAEVRIREVQRKRRVL